MIAVEEAANLTERLMARSFGQLTPEAVESIELSATARNALPSASLRVEVLSTDAAPAAKRITVEIAWGTAAVGGTAPIRVVAWKYSSERETP
jgi:hypothetical protein